jgi:hypothetical protein
VRIVDSGVPPYFDSKVSFKVGYDFSIFKRKILKMIMIFSKHLMSKQAVDG